MHPGGAAVVESGHVIDIPRARPTSLLKCIYRRLPPSIVLQREKTLKLTLLSRDSEITVQQQ